MIHVIAFQNKFLGTEGGGPSQGYKYVATISEAVPFESADDARLFLTKIGPQWATDMARRGELVVRVVHNGTALPA